MDLSTFLEIEMLPNKLQLAGCIERYCKNNNLQIESNIEDRTL